MTRLSQNVFEVSSIQCRDDRTRDFLDFHMIRTHGMVAGLTCAKFKGAGLSMMATFDQIKSFTSHFNAKSLEKSAPVRRTF